MAFEVGDRVVVGQHGKKGTVAFLGETSFSKGVWAGIALDQKAGKHNGTILGQKYFECPNGHGIFIRPERVKFVSKKEIEETAAAPSSPRGRTAQELSMTVAQEALVVGLRVHHFGCAAVIRYLGMLPGMSEEEGETLMGGLELDDPVGNCDGIYRRQRYFETKPDCAVFVPVPRDKKRRTLCLNKRRDGQGPIQRTLSASTCAPEDDIIVADEDKLVDFGFDKLSPSEKKNLTELVRLAEQMAEEKNSAAEKVSAVSSYSFDKLTAMVDGALAQVAKLTPVDNSIDLTPYRGNDIAG